GAVAAAGAPHPGRRRRRHRHRRRRRRGARARRRPRLHRHALHRVGGVAGRRGAQGDDPALHPRGRGDDRRGHGDAGELPAREPGDVPHRWGQGVEGGVQRRAERRAHPQRQDVRGDRRGARRGVSGGARGDALLMWIALWTALALPTMVVLLRVTAPYGRHARRGWGPALPARAAWIAMEAPAALGMPALYLAARPAGVAPAVLLGMWLLHYANRAFVYPLRARAGTPMPASVAAMGLAFNCINVWIQAGAAFAPGAHADAWLHDPRFCAGAVAFVAGWAVNQHADAV